MCEAQASVHCRPRRRSTHRIVLNRGPMLVCLHHLMNEATFLCVPRDGEDDDDPRLICRTCVEGKYATRKCLDLTQALATEQKGTSSAGNHSVIHSVIHRTTSRINNIEQALSRLRTITVEIRDQEVALRQQITQEYKYQYSSLASLVPTVPTDVKGSSEAVKLADRRKDILEEDVEDKRIKLQAKELHAYTRLCALVGDRLELIERQQSHLSRRADVLKSHMTEMERFIQPRCHSPRNESLIQCLRLIVEAYLDGSSVGARAVVPAAEADLGVSFVSNSGSASHPSEASEASEASDPGKPSEPVELRALCTCTFYSKPKLDTLLDRMFPAGVTSLIRRYLVSIDGILVESHGTQGTGPGQFGTESPRGIAVICDGCHSTNSGNSGTNSGNGSDGIASIISTDIHHRIHVFDGEGKHLHEWGGSPEQFRWPGHVAVLRGDLYVADPGNCRVRVLDRNGQCLRTWGTAHFQKGMPFGLAISGGDCTDGGEEVYVGDWENGRIHVFTPEGRHLRQWGGFGPGDGQMSYPRQIAVAHDRVYVADFGNRRVQVFDCEGKFLDKWPLKSMPSALGLFEDEVLVSSLEDGIVHHLDRFNGNHVFCWKLGQGNRVETLTLARQRLFVANSARGCISVYK